MPKGIDCNIIADAYLALTIEYKSYDTSEILKVGELDNIVLSSKIPTQDKLLIRKDLYENLSPEAREIINVILYAPNEILQTLGFKNITKRAVRLYFTKIWNSKWITEITIKELTHWANQL